MKNKGEYDRAIADYDKAIALKPKYADFYNNRGIAYDKKGEYDRAIADYDKAIALNPKMLIFTIIVALLIKTKMNMTELLQIMIKLLY